jgi:hypothetical protein
MKKTDISVREWGNNGLGMGFTAGLGKRKLNKLGKIKKGKD